MEILQLLMLTVTVILMIIGFLYGLYCFWKMGIAYLGIVMGFRSDVGWFRSCLVLFRTDVLTEDGQDAMQTFGKYFYRFVGVILIITISAFLSGIPL
jgi:hypothetical protein